MIHCQVFAQPSLKPLGNRDMIVRYMTLLYGTCMAACSPSLADESFPPNV